MKIRRPTITFWRRTGQLFFFILFVYGGMIFRTELKTDPVLPKLTAPDGMPSTTRLDKSSILWANDDPPVIDAYPPGATCRYNPKGGLVKACIVHMLSENLTWRTKLAYTLPPLLLFIAAAFLAGRWWCGWVCPLGTIGDVLGYARKKLRLGYIDLGRNVGNTLRGASHFLFWSTVGISWLNGYRYFENVRCYLYLPYCQLCPARIMCPLFGLSMPLWRDFTNSITSVFTVLSWGTLVLFLAAFVVGRRVWCRICPIGLVTSWFNRGSMLELRKNSEECNRCTACVDACPMGNTHVREKHEKYINHPDCIFCLRCVEQCPRDRCLSLKFAGITLNRSSFRNSCHNRL